MVDAITLHVEDDSDIDSWPLVALMGIGGGAVRCNSAFGCYYDAQSLYDLHYLAGRHLPMCSGISWLELAYVSAFVFDVLDIERRGMVPASPPVPFPPTLIPFEADIPRCLRYNGQMLSSFRPTWT